MYSLYRNYKNSIVHHGSGLGWNASVNFFHAINEGRCDNNCQKRTKTFLVYFLKKSKFYKKLLYRNYKNTLNPIGQNF